MTTPSEFPLVTFGFGKEFNDYGDFDNDVNYSIKRSVELNNEDWGILAQCAESFCSVFRAKQSERIATYVTRGQLDLAVEEAKSMNILLEKLDKIQAKLV
jgi:hypothetical protein